MLCDVCQRENPPENQFCGNCGHRLTQPCAACGAATTADHAFCSHCGHRLAAADRATVSSDPPEPAVGEHRQLTVLFCDLVGSTALSMRLEPEEYSDALRGYHQRSEKVIARYGGHVAQRLGDGVFAYFGWPQAYDDSAERAVRAGLDLLDAASAVPADGVALTVRVGLHTGTAVVSELGVGSREGVLAIGSTPTVAAAVQSAAPPGQVLISASTHRLVAGLFVVEEHGPQALKGAPQPVDLYRVVQPSGVRGRLGAAAVRGLTPFVNRNEERRLLRGRFEQAADGEGQMILLLGEAGIGKSRLVQMLREELADTPHTWLETGGAPHFANTSFYAVTQLFEQLLGAADCGTSGQRADALVEVFAGAGVDPAEALPLVAPLLGISLAPEFRPVRAAPEVARKRLFAVLAAWVFGAARRQPLVILLEDLHWVDPSTLELQHLLVEQGATEPLLLVYTARPEFSAPWPLRAHHTHLTLNRLRGRHAREMVAGVAARTALLGEVIDQVVARTGGVPLFLEEITRSVIEVGAHAAVREIPTTLADSLMARLDRLGPEAREVAQIGAVCGREFSYELLHAVHPLADADLEAALQKLLDAELLYGHGLPPEATYTFKHALVQDAARDALLKSRRRALHARVATVLTEQFPDDAAAHPEVLGQHHGEAGEIDAAVAAWQRAGERAIDRGAEREAEQHLRQGLALLAQMPAGMARDFQEFHFQLAIGRALVGTKGLGAPEVAATFERARAVGERIAEPEQLFLLLCGRVSTALAREGPAAARVLIEQFMPTAAKVRQPWVHTLVHAANGIALYHAGEFTDAIASLEEGLAAADDSTALPLPLDSPMLMHYHLAVANWQIGLVDAARAHLNRALARAERSSRSTDRAWGAHQAAAFCALARDPAAALAHADRALAVGGDGASPMDIAVATILRGWAVSELGDPHTGLALIRTGLAALTEIGQRLGQEFYHGLLADVHARAGDIDEALHALADGEDACPSQLSSRSGTLLRRAELLRRRPADADDVRAAYEAALACARRLNARSFELRAATAYARWLGDHDRAAARTLLGPVLAGFDQGVDTRDVREALELSAQLQGRAADAPELDDHPVEHFGVGR